MAWWGKIYLMHASWEKCKSQSAEKNMSLMQVAFSWEKWIYFSSTIKTQEYFTTGVAKKINALLVEIKIRLG